MRDGQRRRGALLLADRVATAVCAALVVVLGVSAPFLAGVEGMRSDACAGSCRFDLVGAGAGVIAVGPAASLIGTVALLLLLPRPERPTAWICGLGLAVAVATVAIGEGLITAAVGG